MTYKFLENKYTRIYFELISKRKINLISRENQYCENHHIIPRALGGTDENENMINLTPREHFIAHRLLVRITEGSDKNKMWGALHKTTFSRRHARNVLTSRDYENVRKEWSKYMKENHRSKKDPEGFSEMMSKIATQDWENNYNKRLIVSKAFSKSHDDRKKKEPEKYYENQRVNALLGAEAIKNKWDTDKEWAAMEGRKISERVSGKNNPMFGKKLSAERIKQISEETSRKRWVHNEHESLYIDIDYVDEHINKGFKLGRGWIGVWVNNGIETKKINKKQLNEYLLNGYRKGKMKNYEILELQNGKEVSQ